MQAYSADLGSLRTTYCDGGGESFEERLPLTGAPRVARAFDGELVAATVAAIQRRETGYGEFLGRIIGAGCARYGVFFGGRKVMYFGRKGIFTPSISRARRSDPLSTVIFPRR